MAGIGIVRVVQLCSFLGVVLLTSCGQTDPDWETSKLVTEDILIQIEIETGTPLDPQDEFYLRSKIENKVYAAIKESK